MFVLCFLSAAEKRWAETEAAWWDPNLRRRSAAASCMHARCLQLLIPGSEGREALQPVAGMLPCWWEKPQAGSAWRLPAFREQPCSPTDCLTFPYCPYKRQVVMEMHWVTMSQRGTSISSASLLRPLLAVADKQKHGETHVFHVYLSPDSLLGRNPPTFRLMTSFCSLSFINQIQDQRSGA